MPLRVADPAGSGMLADMPLQPAPATAVPVPPLLPGQPPLAILVDGCSASTAEIMAGGLQLEQGLRQSPEETS